MAETNNGPLPPLAQKLSMIEPYITLLDDPNHLWLKTKVEILTKAVADPRNSLIDSRYKEPESEKDLEKIFSPEAPPYWAVEHFYQKGITTDTIEDIVYGSILKGRNKEGEAIYYDPLTVIIERYANDGYLDLAFNMMMAWDLYHPLKQHILSKLPETDFSRALFITSKTDEAGRIEGKFSDAISKKDYRTALKIAAHSGKENLHLKAINLYERVIYKLESPQSDEEKILLIWACVMQLTELTKLIHPDTYSRKMPIVEYSL